MALQIAGTTVVDNSRNLTNVTIAAGLVPNLDAGKITTGTMGTARLASGTASSSTFLRGDSTWASPSSAPVVDTFNASGTWTKPASGSMARIQVWAGGGGAGRGTPTSSVSGGGGGGYNEIVVPLSTLGATETVTIGAGGAGRTGSTGYGTTGGQTSFGAHCTAYGGGGGGGVGATSGGGGGQLSAGGTGGNIGRPKTEFRATDSGYSSVTGAEGFSFHGGTSQVAPGDALYGGGAGSRGNAEVRGLSVYGGAGGARNNAGVQPGGGGGASSSSNGNGFSGAAGRVVVTVY